MGKEQTIIIVCNGKCCYRDGGNQVLEAFKQQTRGKVQVRTKYCFGKCGNGPMVVVLPEIIWYDHVKLTQVSSIIKRHC